jgi:hypothetical protein
MGLSGSPISLVRTSIHPIHYPGQPDFALLANGLDSHLQDVETSLGAIDASNPLPIVNQPLASLVNRAWLDGMRNSLVTTINLFQLWNLSQATTASVSGAQLIQSALYNSLGPSGSNQLGKT